MFENVIGICQQLQNEMKVMYMYIQMYIMYNVLCIIMYMYMYINMQDYCVLHVHAITTGSSEASASPFLLSLTGSLLSLSSPTRGKYQLLSTLSHHLPVTTLLLTSPTLPTELLSVMGRQALACHVGPPSLVCNYFVAYHQCFKLCCAVVFWLHVQ